ncbi:MAG: hypothetical protein FWF15_10240 [Oscillospiraceae bacterium]|nr:hypothetical protein [Oscillospiraceae bacterium]
MQINRFWIFTLLFSLFFVHFSCQNGSNPVNNQRESNENETSAAAETEINYYKNIPEGLNYDGYTFTIFTWDPALRANDPYIIIEEIQGEVLNDAAYTRNLEVMELLNVNIGYFYKNEGELYNQVVRDNTAGDCPYDIVIPWPGLGGAPSLVTNGQLYDWNKVPYVDLSEDWYNQSARTAYTVNGKQFLCVSDLLRSIPRHFQFLFNKTLCTDYGLEYPYQLVYDGKWTLEVVSRYIKDFYTDLNGDGKEDMGDRFGLVGRDVELGSFIAHWGESPISIGKDGFSLNIFSERISLMTDKLQNLVSTIDVFYTAGQLELFGIFDDGRSLFRFCTSNPYMVREIEVDVGYLPIPKFDEIQSGYITATCGSWMGIPLSRTTEQVSRTGAVVEALSAASSKYLIEAYIKQHIENKVLRDEDSVNMYRIIMNSTRHESSFLFDSTNLLNTSFQYYVEIITNKTGTVNLASQYAKHADKLQTTLDSLYEMMLENQ